MPPPAPNPSSALPPGHPDRVTWPDRLAYGTGTLAENLSKQTLQQMVNPFYNLCLGVSPTAIGVVLALARLYDAFADLFIGNASDNCHSRWGRRRPFLVVGTVALALTFLLLWLPAKGWSAGALLGYFLIASLLYWTALSLFAIPYYSLGFELTPDYHERTRLMAVRALIMPLASILSVWAFALAQWPGFGGAIAGTRWVTVGIIVATLVCGLWPAFVLRERFSERAQAQPPIKLGASIRACLHCRPNLLLCGSVFSLLTGVLTVDGLRLYVCIYYIYDGDAKAGAVLTGLLGTTYQVVSVVAVPLITRWSVRVGKGRALQHCLAIATVAAALQWWGYNRELPYLALVPNILMGVGLAGMWLLSPSMSADVCDYDELATGQRREGMFSAVWGWTLKIALSISALLSGVILDWSGFDVARGAAQDPGTLLWLRGLFAWGPVAALAKALAENDLSGVRAAVTAGREALGRKAGEPEVADEFRRVPADARLLSREEAQRGFAPPLGKKRSDHDRALTAEHLPPSHRDFTQTVARRGKQRHATLHSHCALRFVSHRGDTLRGRHARAPRQRGIARRCRRLRQGGHDGQVRPARPVLAHPRGDGPRRRTPGCA